MHLPWLAQQYQRTCADCGCTWRVPRYFARRHVLEIFNLPIKGSGGAESGAELRTEMKLGEEEESLRECPKCSSVHFSQRPVRS